MENQNGVAAAAIRKTNVSLVGGDRRQLIGAGERRRTEREARRKSESEKSAAAMAAKLKFFATPNERSLDRS